MPTRQEKLKQKTETLSARSNEDQRAGFEEP